MSSGDTDTAAVRPPLPSELQELNEADTACRFCGVSYLLLARMEKLQVEFARLERELEDRKAFALERPKVLAENASLTGSLAQLKDRYTQLETLQQQTSEQLQQWQLKETLWSQKLEAIQDKHQHAERRAHKLASAQQRQSDHLNQCQLTVQGFRTDLRMLRTQLHDSAQNFQACIDQSRETAVSAYAQALKRVCDRYEQQLRNVGASQEQELARLHNEHTQVLKQAAHEADAKLAQLESKHASALQVASAQSQDLESQLKAATERGNSLSNENALLKRSVEDVKGELDTAKQQLARGRQEAEDAIKAKLDLQAQYAKLETTMSSKVRSLEVELSTAQQQLVETKRQMSLSVGQVLSEKEAQLSQQRASITELTAKLAELTHEREAMVGAHQNRIKQLQDSISERLSILTSEKNAELRNAVQAANLELERQKQSHISERRELEQALYQARTQATELEQVRTRYQQAQTQLQKLETAHTDLNRRTASEAEQIRQMQAEKRELLSQLSQVEAQLARLRDTKSSGDEAIRRSKTEDDARFQTLETQLSKHQDEIAALKHTIKLECEERIKLLGQIDMLQRKPASSLPSSEQASLADLSDETAPRTASAASAFESALHKATRKKEKNKKKIGEATYRR
ncbi:hypothetical protein RI367_003985 [Sorochytrium milnesiophthora]